MRQYMGCWLWDEEKLRLVRSDGASLRFVREVTEGHRGVHGVWRLFEIQSFEGKTPLLVERRLIGFHSQYRTLYWRASLAKFQSAGGASPSSYAQSKTFEYIAADGLLCWPDWVFGEAPDWVAVDGAWDEGKFREDRYRLYERTRATKFITGGHVPEVEPSEPTWSFKPGYARRPVPDLSQAARSRSALADALDKLAESAPMLVAKDRFIIFGGEEFHHSKPIYVDQDFVTDRLTAGPPYRGQEHYWQFGEHNKVQIGTIDRRTMESAGAARPKGLIWRLLGPPAETRDKRGNENWPMDPLLRARCTEALSVAPFKIPAGENVGGALLAPPLRVIVSHGWRQGGYLSGRVEIAQTLANDQFVAAFAETPPAPLTIAARAEVRFDPVSGLLEGLSGQSLRFDRAIEGAQGDAFVLRCSAEEIDWPVIVRRSNHVREKLMRWTIDHDEALAHWREQEGEHYPDHQRWDCLRQFLDDALLSWADSDVAGPAAQQLISNGGYYDGQWHGPRLIRTITRPMPYEEGQDSTAGPWTAYQPSEQWVRTDDLPIGLPEADSDKYFYSGGSKEPPIPFVKEKIGGNGRLEASVFTLSHHRDESHRTDYADFRSGSDHLRMIAVRSKMDLCRIWNSPETPPPGESWNGFSGAAIAPDLPTWRILRDSAESGLRPGESVTLSGMWLFNRFFCGFSSRRIEWLADDNA